MLSPQSEPSVERRNDMQYEVIIAEDEELILNNLIQKVNAHPAFKVIGSAQTGTDALDW